MVAERKSPSRFARLFGRKATYNPDQWLNTSAYGGTQWLPARVPIIQGYGSGMMLYAQVYRSQPAVRQVVQFIAENIGQVPIKAYQRISDAERVTVSDHPVARMLKAPNPELSRYEFIRDLVTDLEVFDVAFYQLARVKGELFVTRLYPDQVELRDLGPLGPQTFRVHKGDGTWEDLDRASILYLKGYGTTMGISPIETLRRVISEDEAAGAYREGLYRNGMRNAGVIERPLDAPDWSEKARQRFLDQLTDRFTGEMNTGKPLLLEEGMTWKSDQIAMQSQEYIASRELTVRAVANAYRVSPAILGITDAPYASITAYNQQLYQNVLAPRMTFYTESLERQLFSRSELLEENFYLEFSLEAKLRGSFQEQAAIAQAAVGGPFMTVDEYRAIVNLPPLTDEQRAELNPIAADHVTGADPAEAQPGGSGPTPTGAAETDQPAPSEQPLNAPKHRGAKGKADRAVLQRRKRYAEDLASTLDSTFARMVASAKGGTPYSKSRYGAEVTKDMRPALERMVTTEASRKAAQLGGDFDPKLVQHYLDTAAERVGKNVADYAEKEIDRLKDEPDLAKQNLANISQRVALTLATSMVSFARQEAAKQAGAGTKTWSVTSDSSRHPELDGETVKIGHPFSNGMQYPGDPSGDESETARCECVLDVS